LTGFRAPETVAEATADGLAFGSTTGNVYVSDDQGDHWACASTSLPPMSCV